MSLLSVQGAEGKSKLCCAAPLLLMAPSMALRNLHQGTATDHGQDPCWLALVAYGLSPNLAAETLTLQHRGFLTDQGMDFDQSVPW